MARKPALFSLWSDTMSDFLTNNLATIGVGALVGFIVIFVSVKIIRDKVNGKSSCGGCTGCPCAGSCEPKPENINK